MPCSGRCGVAPVRTSCSWSTAARGRARARARGGDDAAGGASATGEVLSPRLRALTVAYGGLLGDSGEATARMILAEPRRAPTRRGRRGPAAHARDRLPLDVLARRARRVRPATLVRPSVHDQVAIPDSLDEFLAARTYKTRRNLRYYDRRFVARFGERPSLAVPGHCRSRSPFRDTLEVSAKTYQHALGALSSTALCSGRFELGSAAGGCAYVLYIDERPAAFWHGPRTAACSARDDRLRSGLRPCTSGKLRACAADRGRCADLSLTLLDWGFGGGVQAPPRRPELEEADLLVFARPGEASARASAGRGPRRRRARARSRPPAGSPRPLGGGGAGAPPRRRRSGAGSTSPQAGSAPPRSRPGLAPVWMATGRLH